MKNLTMFLLLVGFVIHSKYSHTKNHKIYFSKIYLKNLGLSIIITFLKWSLILLQKNNSRLLKIDINNNTLAASTTPNRNSKDDEDELTSELDDSFYDTDDANKNMYDPTHSNQGK